ncbi:L-aspartate oxidase [Paracoccus denitrificans]|jgi:L-aspartate oxidase|uniref:L-aspartate oxidase n=3 Tax=Paracoccus denitrificans TaxID=266 RepID=A1BAF1_PARDP|nr:L-aspartate oxidase [Paracoccus denitrificans]ABL72495.1 L-aspartate oxidase [Paracoccus denitrificans PD1222]MBB4626487.1 L-aspartate oxidase [Paracoccus denitrificans]MCU7430391.1 L-aspartate oxidase [Paracoccus denitrificans]QAR29040.1 L-aspartate oxidase [Paracoccus denitrificans]UPV97201.1 L-aspartate oxidase [Paracoccus denitrificans]
MRETSTPRVIIVGAGLGALYAALKLAPRPVLMISPEVLGQGASSAWAQGGVAAAMDPADSAQAHARDTLLAGAGTVDPAVAALVTDEARAHILDLTRLGTPFDRKPDGGYVLSREAAHSFARVVRVRGDQAGAEIMRALVACVRETPSVQVLEGVMATGLRVEEGVVAGVEVTLSGPQGSAPFLIRAPAVLLAGGGSGGLYALTTNPPRIRGQVIGMAARAGAEIADAEFVQFHPTAIDCGEDPAPLATEALRGEGAHLVNRLGERFMLAVHPDAELAPRDVVARAIYAQTQAGLRPMLDTRGCLGDRILTEFPAVAGACSRAGIDPTREPIPVAAAAHYHMGGVAVDAEGRASLDRLWVCGEASSTGLHGANRLASNGLLEALVFARRCALSIEARLGPAQDAPEILLPDLPPGPVPDPALVARLRRAMTEGAGVLRDAGGLSRCLREIGTIEAAQPDCPALMNMTATATLIAAAALMRQESRGAHCRTDFPQTAPEGRRSRLRLADALALRASLEPETT